MASLLIFAIGGTVAISILTYTGSNRILLDEQTEAYLIANNVLQTVLLYTQTNPGVVKEDPGALLWTSSILGDVTPPGKWNPWVAIPVQAWNTLAPPNAQVYGEASNSFSGQSAYEWSYSLKDAAGSQMQIKRFQVNHVTLVTPSATSGVNSQLRTLTLAVRWPLSETNVDRRKRVLVSAILSQ